MNDIEEQLIRALKSREPGPNFTENVLARLGEADLPPRNQIGERRRAGAWRASRVWLAAACVAGVLIAGAVWSYSELHKSSPSRLSASGKAQATLTTAKKDGDPIRTGHDNEVAATVVKQPVIDRSANRASRVEWRKSRAEGERAKNELKLALYIASAKLNTAERRVRDAIWVSNNADAGAPAAGRKGDRERF